MLRNRKSACYKFVINVLDIVNIYVCQVPVDTLNGLLGDKEALRKVLLRHVIPGRWVTFQCSDDLADLYK